MSVGSAMSAGYVVYAVSAVSALSAVYAVSAVSAMDTVDTTETAYTEAAAATAYTADIADTTYTVDIADTADTEATTDTAANRGHCGRRGHDLQCTAETAYTAKNFCQKIYFLFFWAARGESQNVTDFKFGLPILELVKVQIFCRKIQITKKWV
jgi:hypothetical protein